MSLGRKAALSSIIKSATDASGQLLFFLVFAVLAKVLSKADFGLVAYAAVFVGFFGVFLRLGYGEALVQIKHMTPRHVATAFWTSVAAGVLMAVITVLAAGPIGAVLSKPEIVPLIRVLAITCVLIGLRTVPSGLLTRDLRFGTLGSLTLIANVVGGAVGIGMALTGWGVWSLVAQRLAVDGTSSLTIVAAARYRPTFEFDTGCFKELSNFSGHVFLLNLINYADQYIDQFLVGWKLGDEALGGYSVSRRLIRTLLTATLGAFRPVSFSAFAKLQHDRQRAANAVCRSTGIIVLFAYPVFMTIAVFAPEVITVVFSQKWEDVAPLTRVFCVLALYNSSMATFSGACKGMGYPAFVTRQRALAVVVSVVLILLLIPYGLLAIAIAYAAKAFVLHPYQMWLLNRATGLGARRFYAALVGPALASAVAVGAATWVDVLVTHQLPGLTRLAVAGLIVLGIQTLLVWRFMPSRFAEIRSLATRTPTPSAT